MNFQRRPRFLVTTILLIISDLTEEVKFLDFHLRIHAGLAAEYASWKIPPNLAAGTQFLISGLKETEALPQIRIL